MVSLRPVEPSLLGEAPARKRVPVLLPRPFRGPFDYAVAPGQAPEPGDIVLVPLNRREEVGVVWDGAPEDGVSDAKLKPITAVLDALPMPAALRRFVDWVAAYTLAMPGEVLAMALRVPALRPETPPAGWRLAPGATGLTKARAHVAAVLSDGLPRSTGDLARAAGVSAGVVRSMGQAGLLEPALLLARPPFATPDPARPGPVLSTAQARPARCSAKASRPGPSG